MTLPEMMEPLGTEIAESVDASSTCRTLDRETRPVVISFLARSYFILPSLSKPSWGSSGTFGPGPSHPEVKRLPGYRSGLNWVRQRKAALEDAMHWGLEGW